GVYAHVGLSDQSSALKGLPNLPRPAPTAGSGAGLPAVTTAPISNPFSLHLPYEGDTRWQGLAVGGGDEELETRSESEFSVGHNPSKLLGFGTPSHELAVPGGAEGVGFEPTDGLPHLRFSRPSFGFRKIR